MPESELGNIEYKLMLKKHMKPDRYQQLVSDGADRAKGELVSHSGTVLCVL